MPGDLGGGGTLGPASSFSLAMKFDPRILPTASLASHELVLSCVAGMGGMSSSSLVNCTLLLPEDAGRLSIVFAKGSGTASFVGESAWSTWGQLAATGSGRGGTRSCGCPPFR